MVESETKSTMTMQGARPECAQQKASTWGCLRSERGEGRCA